MLVLQLVGALVSGSLALAADAAHAATDAAGLVIALLAATLALRPATARRTWGYRRAEVLGATLQAAVLLAVGSWICIEAVGRLFDPADVASTSVLVFGGLGLAANIIGILVLTRGGARDGSVNMRAALLEVVNDALGSVAVLVAAAVIALTGWQQADAIASLVIVALIVPRTLKLLRETVSVLLESTPPGLDLDAVRTHLLAQPRVLDVHDLHASQITTGLPVLTAHVASRTPASTTDTHPGCSTGCRAASPSTSTSASSTPPSSWKPPRTPTTSSPSTADRAYAAPRAADRGSSRDHPNHPPPVRHARCGSPTARSPRAEPQPWVTGRPPDYSGDLAVPTHTGKAVNHAAALKKGEAWRRTERSSGARGRVPATRRRGRGRRTYTEGAATRELPVHRWPPHRGGRGRGFASCRPRRLVCWAIWAS
ncbi:cation diffusion facilitator family transporter [Blastococcus sp. SYSU DS0539]